MDLDDREAQEEAVFHELSVRSENDRRKLACDLAVRLAAAPPAERAAAGERPPADDGLRLDEERLRNAELEEELAGLGSRRYSKQASSSVLLRQASMTQASSRSSVGGPPAKPASRRASRSCVLTMLMHRLW